MKYGTFSYLPEMSPQQLRRQVEYIVARGWNPAIEHAEPGRAAGAYWHMWQLPMFGETSVDRILAEAEACHKAHPRRLVRLVGYDNLRQTLGTALLVYHA
jgi:ribulose-bisphosphate carboxylase small chain